MKSFIFLSFLLFSSIVFLSCGNKEEIESDKKCDVGFTYKENWDSCIDIDECKIENGNCEQNCINKIGSFECSCDDGFELYDNKKCNKKIKNNCKDDSCRGNGECISLENTFTCQCFKGYAGTNCEECADGFEIYGNECLLKYDSVVWGGEQPDVLGGMVIGSDGSIYVIATAWGKVGENISLGKYDFFLTKFNNTMEKQWVKILGTSEVDDNTSITIDSNDNIYISGTTRGNFWGINNGGVDIVLMKLDSDGDIIWKTQKGTSDDDFIYDIALDSNRNIYTIGYRKIEDINSGTFIRMLSLKKFNIFGEEIWTREEDINSVEFSYYITIDDNDNIYIGTVTESNLSDTESVGRRDLVVIKYNSDGERFWAKQWGTVKEDEVGDILYYNDYIYITGYVNGSIQDFIGGSGDVFITKMDKTGNIIFEKNWIENNHKRGLGIIISEKKDIYISGCNWGLNNTQMLLKKIDSGGELFWSKEWYDSSGILISLLFHNDVLYGLGVIGVSYYDLQLLKFNF